MTFATKLLYVPCSSAKSATDLTLAQASVHDIEDIEDLGRKTHTCPYYGSRKAVRTAEVVTLPYNMLMQKTAREALGISLKEQVSFRVFAVRY